MVLFGQVNTGQLWAEWWVFAAVAVFVVGAILVCFEAVKDARKARDEATESERRCAQLMTLTEQLTVENAALSTRYEESRKLLASLVERAEKVADGFANTKAA
jgi:hypothetical protein